MNQKELSEIRRHLTPDKNNIGTVYGCYVNGNKEIISYLDESLGLMDEFETEKYLGFLKKVLSGGLGKGLVDIVFTADQVMNGEEHKLLMSLWSSSLADADAREQLYRKIIETLDFKEHNYLILLVCDHYDVPYRGADGEIQKDASESMFSYLLCSVCPVKDGRPELGYAPMENGFRRHNSVQLVGAPEVGFMFPAFNDRAADLYNAVFYTKDHTTMNLDFLDAVFHTGEIPMSAGEQKAAFQGVLESSLEEDCRFDVVQDLHEHIHGRVLLHKESKDPEPLKISSGEVCDVLRNSGVSEEKTASFQKACDACFGENAALNPGNIMDSKKFQIEAPNVKITVDPEYTCVIQTKVINGRKYLLIPANEGVEVNGVGVDIGEEE